MKNWIISESLSTKTYFIASPKSIWITEQHNDANITELIETRSLGAIKSIPYASLKEIVFIDSDAIIECRYIDDKTTDVEFELERNIYSEIKSYLKSNLKGTEIKNFSLFKQIAPNLILLSAAILISTLTYTTAISLEQGDEIRTGGRRGLIKLIITWIAELLGATGTLIAGSLIIIFFIYLVIKAIQNPKKGELLKIKTSPQLTT